MPSPSDGNPPILREALSILVVDDDVTVRGHLPHRPRRRPHRRRRDAAWRDRFLREAGRSGAPRRSHSARSRIGETETGKGYVARRIHEQSPRRDRPFVEINCASLNTTFFESEIFGHERGVFTDAKQAKRGLLEVAGRGTVFLDEIGEMAPEVQPKLLKVIEEHTFRRLGGTVEQKSEARVIVATHEKLQESVAQRRFRPDLMYRLQVLTIHLPPLRERRDAIPLLAETLAPRGSRLTDAAVRVLVAYQWPGNIRELKNALWRASILADSGEIIPSHLGLSTPPASVAPSVDDLTLATAERQALLRALEAAGGNKTQAARILGIARSTLTEKLRAAPRDESAPD